jgi:hypothetical protein
MRGFHFSLRWLFGVVSFLAVGCGLLIYASPFLSKLTFSATLVVLLAAMPAAVYSAGERRAFWAGFSFFGLAYLWLICGSWQSPDGSELLRNRLATTAVFSWCHEKVARSHSTPMYQWTGGMAGPPMGMSSMMSGAGGSGMMPGGMSGMSPMTSVTVTPDWSDFSTTGHSLFEIVFALLGGVIARRAYQRSSTATGST